MLLFFAQAGIWGSSQWLIWLGWLFQFYLDSLIKEMDRALFTKSL
jgi:hypothetical protein